MKNVIYYLLILALFIISCDQSPSSSVTKTFTLQLDSLKNTISVIDNAKKTVLVQNAQPDFRPYIHPLECPDGKGTMTEYSPGHHKHQTGIYWGFTRVNGRDFFHHPGDAYWRRVDYQILQDSGEILKWLTSYEMLDSLGEVLMTETQNWSFQNQDDRYLLDLEWQGQAAQDITIGRYDYGGLFVRMPWKEGMPAEVINAARDRNDRAEGKRAMWLDLGMQVEGRSDLAHLAIFDHPQNGDFPQPWRVDGQFGIGPSRARLGDWQIPKGHTEVIKHRLEVYVDPVSDVILNERWESYAGNSGMYSTASLWGIAQQEGHSAKLLSPEEAVDAMTIRDGYQVNVWAAEPLITQPMAFCWDDRGRLWVAENRDYESRGDGFSNSGDSRILILEDTNHDGTADTKKVFLEGIAFPAAIAVGFDGVFVGAPPHLLFVPDKNHDDIADLDDIEVRLTGWGIRDRHETLNSFLWGPDGWLYGCQGFATPSVVRKPKKKLKIYRHNDPFPTDLFEEKGIEINGGVWRYHPTKDRFEVVAHGFSNPWGIDYDEHGQIFISACVIPHLWHIIPGGIYQRQGGRHFNPYVYEDIQTIADHRHRSAHGGARIYQSDAFSPDQHGRIFMANIHEHAVLTDVLTPDGSGYVGSHGEDFLLANNAQWIGFSLEIGPDGGLYVLDWHDADICGKEVVNKETGRVFRIMPRQNHAKQWIDRNIDLSQLSDLDLAKLQSSESNWHTRRARLIMQERSQQKSLEPEATKYLSDLLYQNQPDAHRLNALWSLYCINMLTENDWHKLLSDKNEFIRAWTIQLLSEDEAPANELLSKIETMAKNEPSPVVRLYLASMLQRLPLQSRWNCFESLAKFAVDTADHNIPLMLWYAFEPMVNADPQQALSAIAQSPFIQLRKFTARRLIDGGHIEDLINHLSLKDNQITDLLEGMLTALEDRTDIKEPPSWKQKVESLQTSNKGINTLLRNIDQQFGTQETIRTLLSTLENNNATVPDLQNAINQLAARREKDLIKFLPHLLENSNLQREVIQAIAQYDDRQLGELLLSKYAGFPHQVKSEVIQTLSSRSLYGGQLAMAIADGRIPKKEIPAYIARQLRRVVGSGFVEIWGPIDEPDPDIQQSYIKYKNLLQRAAADKIDYAQGALVFQTSCGPCHTMYGKGGHIGPELTGSNRTNIDYLLANILEPNAEIQDDYRMFVVTTHDGRIFTGNKISENDRQITLRVVGQDNLVINKAEIQSTEIAPVSLMPTGILNTLSEGEIVDLLSYLMQAES